MKFVPHIVCAVAVATIAGAVSGATIGDSPVLTRASIDTLPQAAIIGGSNDALRNSSRLPDHYPLETPKGTIEVAELALHGRMRERGGDMWWEDGREAPIRTSAGYDFYQTASPERIAHEQRVLAFTGGRAEPQQIPVPGQGAGFRAQPTMTRAEAPMALAEPADVVTSEASIGKSKTVDVAAALAQRQ